LNVEIDFLADTIQIADLFFVHHRGSMNGLYMIMMMIGVCDKSFKTARHGFKGISNIVIELSHADGSGNSSN
jgi:hypothetical protein